MKEIKVFDMSRKVVQAKQILGAILIAYGDLNNNDVSPLIPYFMVIKKDQNVRLLFPCCEIVLNDDLGGPMYIARRGLDPDINDQVGDIECYSFSSLMKYLINVTGLNVTI